MKRLFAFAIAIFLAASATAQTTSFPAFRGRDARSSAFADVFRTVSSGTDSFFGNPAGYIGSKQDILVVGAQSWMYGDGRDAIIALLPDVLSGGPMPAPGENFRGFGLGFKIGAGFAGRGLGLGVFLGRDSFVAKNPGETSIVDAILCGVFGAAIPVEIGFGTLRFGVDIRPFYRLRGLPDEAAVADFAASGGDYGDFSGGTQALSGVGVAVNAGVIWDAGPVSVGFVARDISPSFPVVASTVKECMDSILGGGSGGFTPSGTATLDPDISLGLCWRPMPEGRARSIFDPRLGAEFRDIYGVALGTTDIADALAVGIESVFASTLALRAGLNGSRLSFGIGFRLLAFDLDAAVFDLAEAESGRSGVAIRFNFRL
ncbi:MAG: hypothetical protein NT080_01670 [Spirochaetes bacterium]|nr:hypothetical protein [Spirochaetota bacterium]